MLAAHRSPLAVVALVVALTLTACTPSGDDPPRSSREVVVVSPPDPDAPRHTHETALGDGTTAAAGGFEMVELTFPARAGEPGLLSFRIVGPGGGAVLDYTEEQTKRLHLYVVRDDVSVFRHLHPELAADGTWSTYVDVAEAGRYRVVAEFVPTERSGGSHVVLGAGVTVRGPASAPAPVEARVTADGTTATDGVVTVVGPSALDVGTDEELTLTLSDGTKGVLNLGTYLGSYAHLTGFETTTGAFVHVHPLGAPTTSQDGSELRFHTSFTDPGTYRFFVQVRVDGFVHTLPLTITVR